MHAVTRIYSGKGANELIDVLAKHTKEIETLIRGVKGFVSYSLVRTADGGFTVSVYQDKAGTDESIVIAREWIKKNASSTGAPAPKITEGSVILQLK